VIARKQRDYARQVAKLAGWIMTDAESGAADYFAAELKAQRAQRGWTQVETGEKIGYSGSYVSDIERGDRMSTLLIAQACDRAFGTPGTFERWHEIAKRAAYPSFFAPVLPLEQEAARIHGWALGAVPGLLQTERYARSVIQARRPQANEATIERTVTARMERQSILAPESPPLLWYVLHEGILRHVVGDREIMGEQLDSLIKAASLPGIVLQVLPFTAPDHAGVEGPITIYERSSVPAVGYTECYAGGRIVEDGEEVADLLTVLGMLRAAALSPRDSLALMKEIRRELDD
jgi:transcriptional regulator with XRE-family HTH domain